MIKFDSTTVIAMLARVCLSSIFLISGIGKLLSPAPTVAEIAAVGLPLPWIAYVAAVAIELLCGIALVAGFALRWAAGILAAFTMIAGLIFHAAIGDPNQFTHLLKNVTITGGLLHVIALGNVSTQRGVR
jgi:putative oxidoreductase